MLKLCTCDSLVYSRVPPPSSGLIVFFFSLRTADFSNAVCSPPGTPKRADPVGVVYWQVRTMLPPISLLSFSRLFFKILFFFLSNRLQKCERESIILLFTTKYHPLTHEDDRGLYDPLKVDVWSLGATTWELAHGDPPFADVQDTRLIVGHQLPPVREPETLSRSFHDFLHLCSQPVASRPDPDELLNVRIRPPPFVLLPILIGLWLAGLFYTHGMPALGDCSAAGPV